MVDPVKIGKWMVGDGHSCKIIAEIGINHNGDIDIAKKLIDEAVESGCDAVKFQKRTVNIVYSELELAMQRENPFGPTNGDLKHALELGYEQYKVIDVYCKNKGIPWFASCWDESSVDFLEQFNPICYKIASASLTDDDLLRRHRKTGRSLILSTGMSTLEQIDHAVKVLGTEDLMLMHCTSTYPTDVNELNLACIPRLKKRYNIPVGYSGHEVGLSTTIGAAVLGACMVERHITLDRSMWGSDQAASVESQGFKRIVRDIRVLETAMGDGNKIVYDSELPIIKKIRRIGA